MKKLKIGLIGCGGRSGSHQNSFEKMDNVEIVAVACVLTEGTRRTDYKGIPLVCLDHIPLPGKEEE